MWECIKAQTEFTGYEAVSSWVSENRIRTGALICYKYKLFGSFLGFLDMNLLPGFSSHKLLVPVRQVSQPNSDLHLFLCKFLFLHLYKEEGLFSHLAFCLFITETDTYCAPVSEILAGVSIC